MTAAAIPHAPEEQDTALSGLARRAAPAAIAVTAILTAAFLYRELRDGVPIRPWQASQYWVSYEYGFVRRGLPGHLVAWLSGGPPTSAVVTAVAVSLALTAAGSFALIAWMAARMVSSRTAAALLATLLVSSPFTFSLLAQDIGRYDTIGVIAAAAVVMAALRARPAAVPLITGLAVLVAAASGEFLAAFLAPLAVVAMRRTGSRPAVIAFSVLPALVLAAASLLVRPDPRGLLSIAQTAHVARADIPADGASTAVAALGQDTQRAVANLGEMSPLTLPALTLILGGCYIVTVWLAWVLLGRREPGLFWPLAALYGAAAVALSVIGIDYRRWWALAFVAAVSTAMLLVRDERRSLGRTQLPDGMRVLAVLGLSVLVQVAPVSASAVDPAAATHLTITTETAGHAS